MIVIVGAGVSGLALATELARAGTPFTVFEAEGEVGGVIRTVHRDGHRLELGPQRVRALPAVARILAEMPGPHHHTPDLPVMVARGGELHPLPRTLPQALGTRAVSVSGKLRAALEPLAALRPLRDGVSAAELLRSRLGSEVYRTFAGPLLGGLYGSDPEEMDADRTLVPAMETLGMGSFVGRLLPRFGRGRGGDERGALLDAPMVVPAGGMAALPRHLAEVVARTRPGALRLGCAVRGIRRRQGKRGYVVETDEGTVEAQAVILTLPPGRAADLLKPSAPSASRILRGLRTNPLALVHVAVPHLPPALGFQVAFGEPQRMRGATFSGNLDGTGRSAVVYLGGMPDPDFPSAPDRDLMETASTELETLTGTAAHPIHVHRTRMPAWDRSWRAMDDLVLPPDVHLLTNYSGRPGILGRMEAARRLAEQLATQPPRARRTAQ